MGIIVDCVDLPAMGIGVVNHMCKTGVIETKTWTTEISLGGYANNGVHNLIEYAAMRDH